jgi:two-component system, cell cycle response regulator CpdR
MTIRVLIADDQDIVRAGLTMILDAQPDIEVVGEAANGREAVTLARELRPDVCLLDIRMPEMDGIEMAMAAAALFPAMKIMLMTGYADQRERAEELNGIILDVVQKPFTLAEIRSRVERALICFA